ncbi:hypothetical protein BD289DRAFT_479307 [Coniella lustricola]|uniref:Uncharacterized protein n=1 Tax=Coniella lustricola TaxID=2025994 RepID=A0A2T3AJW7_9PEZI|nr:hypothetical protein BD289DRAFT_479307 [Coniella lustricola]
MSNFLEDPRLRQRWNQISHTTETVTENAAAGIWTFQHNYINPCLASLSDAVEPCIAPCFGDRDERARWARAREHHQQYATTRAEYTFDFYDDWDDDDELLANSRRGGYYGGGGGAAAGGTGGGDTSRGEDWDRLIGGSGAASAAASSRKGSIAGEVGDQPRRKRGMSYGTRGGGGGGGGGGGSGSGKRNKSDEEDLTIIPSTAPLGFLSRLPWKIGGTLRYKPSAAFLQDHPGAGHNQQYAAADENQPLLDSSDGEDVAVESRHLVKQQPPRKRSSTGGSGDTSDSFRSRGDLFPSDGEEYDDAMEIDDEFAVALERVDDRASSKTTPSSKGKRPAGGGSSSGRRLSRTISGTTISTRTSKSPLRGAGTGGSLAAQQRRRSYMGPPAAADDTTYPHTPSTPSIEDLHREEEEEAQRQEDQEIARKREAASQLARERGLSASEHYYSSGESESRAAKSAAVFRVGEVDESRKRSSPAPEPAPIQPAAGGDDELQAAVHSSHAQDDIQENSSGDVSLTEQQRHRGDTTEAEAPTRRRAEREKNHGNDGHLHHAAPPPPPSSSAADDFIPARLPNFQ